MSDHNPIAKPVFDQAIEVIQKTSPHFIPIVYECDLLVNGHLAEICDWVNPEILAQNIKTKEELSNDVDLKKCVSFAQGYKYGRIKSCLNEAQRDDVMIVIVGIVPINENVAPDGDVDIIQIVCPDDSRPTTLAAYCFFLSELKSELKYVPLSTS